MAEICGTGGLNGKALHGAGGGRAAGRRCGDRERGEQYGDECGDASGEHGVSSYGGGRVPVGSSLLMPECARVMRGHHEEQPTELPTELDVPT